MMHKGTILQIFLNLESVFWSFQHWSKLFTSPSMTQWTPKTLKNKVQICQLHFQCSCRWFVDSADPSHIKRLLQDETPHFLLHIMGHTSYFAGTQPKQATSVCAKASTTLPRAKPLTKWLEMMLTISSSNSKSIQAVGLEDFYNVPLLLRLLNLFWFIRD